MVTTKFLLRFAVFFGSLYSHAFILHSRHRTSRQGPQRNGLMASSSSSTNECVSITSGKDEESFTDKLLGRLRRNDTSPVVVEGYVTSKRSIGKNLAFLDFQVDHGGNQRTDDNHNLCQALLRKDIYTGNSYDGYRRCLLKGCKFRLTGVASPTKIPGNVVLMLHSMELLALPRQAQHIQIILQQAVDGGIPFKEAVRACSAAQHNVGDNGTLLNLEESLLSLNTEQTTSSAEIDSEVGDEHDSMIEMERRKIISQGLKRLAKDILHALPDDPQYPVAADPKVLSKEGNFMVPLAPKEWQTVPKGIEKDIENSKNYYHDLTATSRLKETLMEMTSVVNNDDVLQIDTKSARVSITGWVQNRRRFEGNITMIYLVDNMDHSFEGEDLTKDFFLIGSLDRLPCLVHPDVLCGNGQQSSGMYQNLIGSGSKVRIEGQVLIPKTNEINGKEDSETRPTSPLLLWVQNIRLVRSSYRSVNIRHLLDLLYQKQIDPKEASEALMISHEDAKQLSFQSDATERQWKANLLAVQLQKEASSENNSTRRINPVLLQVMEKYRYLSKIHPVIATGIEEGKSNEDYNNIGDSNEINSSSLFQNAENSDTNDSILEKRNRKRTMLSMPGSKWQTKKKPQLEWMGRQIREVLESHPDFRKRKLTILDIGGGKGALANYLGQHMGHLISVHVLDISQEAVMNGKKKAERLDLPVDFQFADASNSNLLDAVDADIVVALHACGHLSDVALNHAVHRRAGFVIVPCCFNSNPHLMIPSNDGGNGNDKNSNLISVPDWLGLSVGDWSALKLLAEVQDDIPLASEAIGILCAIRAEAVKKKSMMTINKEEDYGNSSGNFNVDRAIEIKSFPIQYSTRNTVLVGKCS
jgi:2-polyprenyl-3-methyl-5-hydroxy-6-metoxy-1,4-benzoquinol methylase